MSEDNKTVSEFWGRPKEANKPQSWLEHPVCRRLINQRQTGDAKQRRVGGFPSPVFSRTSGVSAIAGCGLSPLTAWRSAIASCEEFHACDLSSNAVAEAKAAAEADGISDRIEYSVADLNSIELPPRRYDVVFAMGSIHHVFQLETLFKQILKTLKPGAFFVLDEYVGPSRFQSSPLVTEVINRNSCAAPEKV